MYLYSLPIDPFEMLHDGPLNNFDAGILMLGGKRGQKSGKTVAYILKLWK